jgi:hypothetical protein
MAITKNNEILFKELPVNYCNPQCKTMYRPLPQRYISPVNCRL